jgi:hypothetical protein
LIIHDILSFAELPMLGLLAGCFEKDFWFIFRRRACKIFFSVAAAVAGVVVRI